MNNKLYYIKLKLRTFCYLFERNIKLLFIKHIIALDDYNNI